jgi:hypothetical protein
MRRQYGTAISVAAACVMSAALCVSMFAQAGSAVPRSADGKPDLTGVWQGGSTQRGSWDEANRGVVGGSESFRPATLVERPPGRAGGFVSAVGRRKVLEAFNSGASAIHRPVSASGPAPPVMLGLFRSSSSDADAS